MAYNVEKLSTIDLGRQGENLARTVEIDVSSLLAQWPDAIISLLCKRKHDTVPYVAVTEVKDGMLIWPITSVETEAAGDGKIELRAVCGEVIAKSMTAVIRVTASLTGSETQAPDAAQGWVDQVLAAGSGVEANAIRAEEAATRAEEIVSSVENTAEQVREASKVAGDEATAAKTSAEQARQASESASADAVLAEQAATDAEKSAFSAQESASASELSRQASDASVQSASEHMNTASIKAQEAKASADAAEKSATEAASSKDAAFTSAGQASASEGEAKKASEAAAGSASAADQSRVDAAKHAADAGTSAEAAQISANAAANSAAAANASQNAAAQSASSASTDAVNARQAAEGATGSAASAERSASGAETSALNAKQSEDKAKKAADDAAGSATDASASKDAAAKSAEESKTSADASAQSAQAAADSSTVAEESKTAAGKSAEAAARDAGSAKASADNAAASAASAEEAAQRALTIINDTAVEKDSTWSSKQLADKYCQPFSVSGNPAICHPVERYPLSVSVEVTPKRHLDWVAQEGVSTQITTTGNNLLDGSMLSIGGITGAAGTDYVATNRIRLDQYIPVIVGEKYTLTIPSGYKTANTHIYDADKVKIGAFSNGVAIPENGTYIRFSFEKSDSSDVSQTDVDVLKNALMVNAGDTALSFESYSGGVVSPSPEWPQTINDSIPADSYYVASAASDGGYWRIDLDEALGGIGEYQDTLEIDAYTGHYRLVRNTALLVLDGTQAVSDQWGSKYKTYVVVANTDIKKITGYNEKLACICNYYNPGTHGGAFNGTEDKVIVGVVGTKNIDIRDTNYSTSDDFRMFLAERYAAGVPITIRYARDKPLVSIEQATHVTTTAGLTLLGAVSMGLTAPNPNHPCEITVADEIGVTRCGTNLWSFGDRTFTHTELIVFPVPLPSGLYSFVADVESSGTESMCTIAFFGESNNQYVNISVGTRSRIHYSFPFDVKRILLYASKGNQGSIGVTATYKNIMLIQGEDAEYLSYQGATYTAELPDDFIGGTIEVTGGRVGKEWRKRVLTGDEAWQMPTSVTEGYSNYRAPTANAFEGHPLAILCTHLMGDPKNNYNNAPHGNRVTTFLNATSPTGQLIIQVSNDVADYQEQTTVAAFKAWLKAEYDKGTPVTIYYKVAESVEEEIDAQAITALDGQNTVFTDAQSVTVAGRESPIRTIETLTERIAALETAATTT